MGLVEQIEKKQQQEQATQSFMGYVKHMWPGFIEGRHHKIMANAFDRILSGECKRLIINMPPRHTKSEFASKFLPSMFFGLFPDKKIIQSTHTADFSKSWGRKVRNLVATPKYQDLFPGTRLMADAKAAGKWDTSEGGEYNAVGTTGGVAGKGADLFIIDDPHTEQDYMSALGGDAQAFNSVYEWYQTGPRQRLQPGAAIVIVMTRWHKRDLTGRLIEKMTSDPDSDEWEIIEFPAIMPESDTALWPEYWSTEELLKTKAGLSVPQWNAQYLQNPTSEEGAIVKREWWKVWEKDEPPDCEFIIQSWDTAFSAKEVADYSACTDWGVFYKTDEEGKRQANIILLDAWRKKVDFPSLKKIAYDRYQSRQPDSCIIEQKASGTPLTQELRMMGLVITEVTPTRGNDKTIRLNAVSDVFASGLVWYPPTRWAEEVIEETAAYPFGDYDDYMDTVTQAIKRFRDGGFISLYTDEDDEPVRRRTYSPY